MLALRSRILKYCPNDSVATGWPSIYLPDFPVESGEAWRSFAGIAAKVHRILLAWPIAIYVERHSVGGDGEARRYFGRAADVPNVQFPTESSSRRTFGMQEKNRCVRGTALIMRAAPGYEFNSIVLRSLILKVLDHLAFFTDLGERVDADREMDIGPIAADARVTLTGFHAFWCQRLIGNQQ